MKWPLLDMPCTEFHDIVTEFMQNLYSTQLNISTQIWDTFCFWPLVSILPLTVIVAIRDYRIGYVLYMCRVETLRPWKQQALMSHHHPGSQPT